MKCKFQGEKRQLAWVTIETNRTGNNFQGI